MKTIAHCAESFVDSARTASGVEPTTCPPMTSDTFDAKALHGADFWYIDLHGEEGWPQWYGDNGVVAILAEQVAALDLSHTVVFAANCFLGEGNSPMLQALLKAKAKAVVAAPGKNYSPTGGHLYGAALLGMWFRRMLMMRLPVQIALGRAKDCVRGEIVLNKIAGRKDLQAANEDALAFRVFTV